MTSPPAPRTKAVDLSPATPAETAADGVAERLQTGGFAAYRVGGAVRDRLLGKYPDEVDIATDAPPAAVKAFFPRSFAVGESFGVVVVHTAEGEDVEVATFRADGEYADGRRPQTVRFSDMATDAQRRDFTINALFYDPAHRLVVDHVGGLDDLHRGVLRAIGEADRRFAEDRLRMLRAVRFATALNFAIDPATRQAVARHAAAIRSVSSERILNELTRMLAGPRPARAMEWLSELGLLSVILPEVEAMKGVEQPPEFHPEGDVWRHTLLLLDNLRWPAPALAWSVLLHDVGKPPCQTFDGKRYRFNGHPGTGADIARNILRRLKASNRLTDTVCACVAGHMSFMNVPNMRQATFRRFVARATFPLELELHRLDCVGSHSLMGHYCFILDQLATFARQPAIPPPLLSGRDVLALGVAPGPLVGTLLAIIQEKQLEGELDTRQDALDCLWRLTKKGDRSRPSPASECNGATRQ